MLVVGRTHRDACRDEEAAMSEQPDEKSMLDLHEDTEGASMDADQGNEGAKNDPKPGNHERDEE
jgi:hypothetical protein